MPGGSPMLGPTQRGVPWWEPEYPGQTPNDTEQRQPPKACPCTPGQWQPSTPTRTGYVMTTKPPTDAAGNAETRSRSQGDTGHRGVAPNRRAGREAAGVLPPLGLAGVGLGGLPGRSSRLAGDGGITSVCGGPCPPPGPGRPAPASWGFGRPGGRALGLRSRPVGPGLAALRGAAARAAAVSGPRPPSSGRPGPRGLSARGPRPSRRGVQPPRGRRCGVGGPGPRRASLAGASVPGPVGRGGRCPGSWSALRGAAPSPSPRPPRPVRPALGPPWPPPTGPPAYGMGGRRSSLPRALVRRPPAAALVSLSARGSGVGAAACLGAAAALVGPAALLRGRWGLEPDGRGCGQGSRRAAASGRP